MTTTKATITIEIEVPVSGTWVPAEPDVGINDGYFEDAGVEMGDWSPFMVLALGTKSFNTLHAFKQEYVKLIDAADKIYADAIQEALADARQGEKEDAADARYDEARDNRGMDDA